MHLTGVHERSLVIHPLLEDPTASCNYLRNEMSSQSFPNLGWGTRTPPFGPFLCTRFRNPKSENQKIKKWSLRNDFRAGTTPVQITEMGSVKNSFFVGHGVV